MASKLFHLGSSPDSSFSRFQCKNQRWKRKPFRFKVMWLTDPECSGIISMAWAYNVEGSPMVVATKKMAKCKKMLKAWNRDQFGNVL